MKYLIIILLLLFSFDGYSQTYLHDIGYTCRERLKDTSVKPVFTEYEICDYFMVAEKEEDSILRVKRVLHIESSNTYYFVNNNNTLSKADVSVYILAPIQKHLIRLK